MNIEELGRIRDQEREKDSLQHLPDDFYGSVGAYLADLRSERDRAAEAADDPFEDAEVRRLSDELETAERIAEAIYERRVGKIVKLASFEAADMSADTEGLTAEERDLCESIVTRIRENRSEVLDTISDGVPSEPMDRGGTATETDVDEESNAPEEDPDRTTVRITRDLGEIVGTDDRTYDLAADDIVSLPTKSAEPLLTRGAAEPVE